MDLRRDDRRPRSDRLTVPVAGLLDTSVFVADEIGRPLRRHLLPERSSVSVVTVAELRAGVLAAEDGTVRSARLRTMQKVDVVEVLAIDDVVAEVWAELRVHVGRTARRINVNDLWIAATAAANGLPVFTQDVDFDGLEGVSGLVVVRV